MVFFHAEMYGIYIFQYVIIDYGDSEQHQIPAFSFSLRGMALQGPSPLTKGLCAICVTFVYVLFRERIDLQVSIAAFHLVP